MDITNWEKLGKSIFSNYLFVLSVFLWMMLQLTAAQAA